MNARAERFPLMDSLRALAALSVVAIHVALPAGRMNPGVTGIRYVGRLDVGVAVFFLISGFLLYRPFVRARDLGEPQPSTLAYLWRRALRIIPAYWLALTVTALVLGLPGVFTGRGLWSFYGFAQIYSNKTDIGGISQAWTLDIEITFYLLLPVWARLMRRTRMPELAGCALLFVAGVLWKVPFVAGHDPVPATWALRSLPAFLDHFALGMGLAVLSVRWQRDGLPRGIRVLDRFPGLAWGFAALCFWAVSTRIGLTGQLFEPVNPHEFLLRHELYGLVGLGMILPAVLGDPARGFIRRHILANRGLLWLGLLSYGIYLWHQTAVHWLIDWRIQDLSHEALPPVFYVAAIALATALAAVSYYGFERPILRLKRLVPPKRATRAASGEAIAEPAPAAPPGAP